MIAAPADCQLTIQTLKNFLHPMEKINQADPLLLDTQQNLQNIVLLNRIKKSSVSPHTKNNMLFSIFLCDFTQIKLLIIRPKIWSLFET